MPAPKTVGQLEAALFAAFPREDAESWDRPGLAVGDRAQAITKIAVALDMSTEAVLEAADAGANVLVTHHPPYIKQGPLELGPAEQAATPGPGRIGFEDARRGISVLAMHTNCDRALATREAFARPFNPASVENFEHLQNPARHPEGTGFGVLMELAAPQSLEQLAETCAQNFGGSPRVWGCRERQIQKFAYLNGSWNDPELYPTCIQNQIDAIIVGETGYHMALDAQPHLAVIELGHDKSELPIVGVLADTIEASGINPANLVLCQASQHNWWTPEW